MSKAASHLGILTQVQEGQSPRGTFTKAWIKRSDGKSVFFHQNSLLNTSEINGLVDGQFIFFDTKVKKGEKSDRLDAINCAVAEPAQLLNFLIEFGNSAIGFVREHAPPALLLALQNEADQLDTGALESQKLNNLAEVRSQLTQKFIPKPKPPQVELTGLPEINRPEPVQGATRFLHNMFATNSPEYNRQLFVLLADGIKSIDNEESFAHACFLLKFNDQLTEGNLPNLKSKFYELGSPLYRFQFWLHNIVPYCDTDVLLTEFVNGDSELRSRILQRCPADKLELLTSSAKSTEPSSHVEAHFSHIKTTLLAQLNLAQASIQIAVAWFTHDELFGLLCTKLEQGVRVELMINNDYINNWEYGLPFNEFIKSGGQLYMSESPSIMHHKFCLIDDAVLLTGSYNWTYYAELRNEENLLLIKDDASCIGAFKTEFIRLKKRLGEPVQDIQPFPATELPRFERLGFREYLSKDIESRVSYTKKHRPKADIQTLAQWLGKAVEIDEHNTTARQLQQSLAPAVELEQRVIQSQHTVQQVLSTAPASAAAIPASVPTPSPETPVVETATPTASPEAKPALIPSPHVSASQIKPIPPVPRVIPPRPVALSSQVAASTAPAINPRPNVSTSLPAPSRPAAAPVTVDTKVSVPESKDKGPSFENLQLVFALDYSNSMEAHGNQGKDGYKLYSTGKVQKVIDMIFAISKGLTASKSIDMFLFEKKAIQLPPVTEHNYQTYIQNEVLQKHKMDRTNIFAPIQAIDNKYTAGKEANTNVFVILITDGENNEEADNQLIKKYFSDNGLLPVFWQFVGLGNDFTFLEEVAEIASNTAFFSIKDVDTVAKEDLSVSVLQSFPHWFKQLQDQGRAR